MLQEYRQEGAVDFVHVYWSPDETKVGLTADGAIGFNLAYDVATGREIPFEAVREGLAESIRETYHLRPDQDPLKWQGELEASDAFFKLHPEIRLSYR